MAQMALARRDTLCQGLLKVARYEFTQEDLSKRTGERRKMALEALEASDSTCDELADIWGIHTISVFKVLERLRKKKYVDRDRKGLGATYIITDKGREKLEWLRNKPETSVEESSTPDLGALYPDHDLSGDLIEGPVALLRPIEVDYEEFSKDGIDSLSSKTTLDESFVTAEPKYDGWLAQVAGGKIYTRRGRLLSGKFPPLDGELSRFDDHHLIGELVYWTPDKKQLEPVITSVAGSNRTGAIKKLAEFEAVGGYFQINFFDILACDGKDVSVLPFSKRRDILEDVIGKVAIKFTRKRLVVTPSFPFEDWEAAFKLSIDSGGEGIVLKNNNAPYFWKPLGDREPRPSGVQWKVKAVRADNFVVFGYRRGEKGSLLVRFGQFWLGELVEVGEMGSLSAENEKEFLRRLDHGPVLVEIAYQERFPKPPGKLRNPRFRRFRDDVALEPDNAALPRRYAPKE